MYTNTIFSDIGYIDGFDEKIFSTREDEKYFELKDNNTCIPKIVDNITTGLNNFRSLVQSDILSDRYTCNSDKITMLGDLVYVNPPKYEKWWENSEKTKSLTNRLACGWSIFRNTINEILDKCEDTRENRLDKFTILLGNHSWDVNYKAEALQMESSVPNKGYYIIPNKDTYKFSEYINQTADLILNSPRFEVGKIGNKPVIVYLDYHIMGLICYLGTKNDGLKYEDCRFKEKYSSIQSEQDAKEYLYRLIYALTNFDEIGQKEKDADKAYWRVLRTHHPLWNIEGNKHTQSYFWTYKLRIEDTKNGLGVGKSLLDLFREAKVTFLLSGHHHSSQIIGYPYNLKYNESLNKCKLPSSKPEVACWYNYGLYDEKYDRLNPFKANLDNKSQCDDNDKIKNMLYKVKNGIPETIFNFITGQSGRDELDAIEELGDLHTPGALVWARAFRHGGIRLEIPEDGKSISIKFFEKKIDNSNVNKMKDVKTILTMNFNYVLHENNDDKNTFDEMILKHIDQKILDRNCGPSIPQTYKYFNLK